MRKLLVVFPDPSESHWGGQRLHKLCERLPELGWEPLVVAAPPAPWSEGEWPGVVVHRTFDANLHRLAARLKRGMSGPEGPSGTQDGSGRTTAREPAAQGLARRALVRAWPHYYTGWPPFAVLESLRLVRRERPAAILSSYPPVSAHVTALVVARLTGLPWVADFRDPWATAGEHAYPSGGGAAARIGERMVFSAASAASAIGPSLAAEFERRHHRRVLSLPQGIPDLGQLPPRPSSAGDTLTLLHAGSVGSWSGDLSALARAALRLTRSGRPIRVLLLGDVWDWPSDLAAARDAGVVEAVARVPRSEALQAVRDADVALLVRSRPGRIWVTTKLWDYLAVGVPILALVDPDSDVARIVEETRSGYVAPYADDVAIERQLEALHERRREGRLDEAPDADRLRGYRVSAVSERFAALLEEIA